MDMSVSRLNTFFDTSPRTYPLQTIALEMRKGTGTLPNLHENAPARTLAETTAYARELLQTRGHDAYAQIKETMPQFLPAVVATSRAADDIHKFSGLVCLEWDNEAVDTAYAFVLACQNPHVGMAWRSLSGKPKILVRVASESVDSEPLGLSTFPHAWVSASQMFEEIAEVPDTTAARPLQLQNLCFDPDLYLNLDAVPLDWSVDTETLRETLPQLLDDLTFERFSALGQEYRDAFARMAYNEQGIGKERVPCPFTHHENDGWGLRSNACRVIQHGAYDYTLQCFKCSKSKRYNADAKEPKRYTADTDFHHETSDMETERTANENALVKWLQETEKKKGKHLLILGSAAGTGKTTVAITTAENLLYIAKTTEEADQVFQTLFDAENDVVRHRSRLYNRNREDWDTLPLGLTENDRPCIQPELCNLYAERGHPTHEVCQRCPFYAPCQEEAYLSQDTREKNASKVVYAETEKLACDEVFKGRVKRICSQDDILIMDEVNPANVTQHRTITREMLFDLTERFRDSNTAEEFHILKALLERISTAEDDKAFMDGLTAWIDTIDDVETLDDKFQKFPVGYVFHDAPADKSYRFVATMNYGGKEVTVPVVSHETALDTPVFEVEPDQPLLPHNWQHSYFSLGFLLKVGLADINDPPRRHHRFLTDIQTFFAENKEIETAPFTYDPKAQTFDFHLKPTLNHRRVIFNTASDPDALISAAYRETGIHITKHTGQPPAWKRPLVFQLSTGNYLPRQSLIKRAGKALILETRAKEMIDSFVLPSLQSGLKTLIVAPKAFQEVDYLQSLACEVINHHHAEGRNDYQDCDIVFVFHYEPNHHDIKNSAKRFYRNEPPLDFAREKRAVTVGGVSFEKNAYTDDRVQAVYNRECRQRLMQSAMRLRPNLHDGKIIVFLTAEPVDMPVTPVPFSFKDGEGFTGDWGALREKLQTGETRTVQEISEQDGVSESTAYRQTAAARKQSKAERDIEIIRRHTDGESKKKIAAEMGISRPTVDNVLKKQKF